MEQLALTAVFLVALFFLLGTGVWIGLSLLGVGWIAMALFTTRPIGDAMVTTIWGASSSWTLTALPLFIWMGEILFRSKMSEDMFRGLAPWMSGLPGRLLHTNIIGCTIFAAISGSSAATCATIGKMTIPELRRRGYPEFMTIGTLADATAMSKSGLFAHFGSREELLLAVLAHGQAEFTQVVFQPAMAKPRGLPRLRAMFTNWLDWTESAELPGGCPMIGGASEFDDRPGPVRDMLASGSLSAGHARALIPTSDPIALAKTVVAKGMSVRDAERLAQNDIKAQGDPNHSQAPRKDEKDADTLALERTLSDVLGLDVTVNHKGSGGQLRIAYKTLEQLEEICRLLERR